MSDQFEIYPYNKDILAKIFAEKSNTDISIINRKSHLQFFDIYLTHIQTKTILVENCYIDHDYLEDFSGYYVKTFHPYSKVCTRLHFFENIFDEEKFNELLSNPLSVMDLLKKIKESYLGFVVVKPIPQTFIGRTCLKTYPYENHRYFPIITKYESNLFGINLNVQSLAYQEQDSIVAACATSALWSVFQGTGRLFQHAIPSPVEITKAATEHLPLETRCFPNSGLSPEQMAHAVRKVNLEPYLINANNYSSLKSSLYAYMRCEIPLVLGCGLFKKTHVGHEHMGDHAVAITGFNINNSLPSSGPLRLTSNKIDKCYVHDDQVGPFARMEFDNIAISINGISYDSLLTSWRDKDGNVNTIRAIPFLLLIPLYHKIRIPSSLINEIALYLYKFFKYLGLTIPYIDAITNNLEWDIYLTTISSFKKTLIEENIINGSSLRELLIKSMPKFIWSVTAQNDKNKIITFLFDATDIEQGNLIISPIEYDNKFTNILRQVAKDNDVIVHVENNNVKIILEWFRNN